MSELTFEEQIRKRAYELWQADGSLEGCADEYWRLARALVEAETRLPVSSDGKNRTDATPQ